MGQFAGASESFGKTLALDPKNSAAKHMLTAFDEKSAVTVTTTDLQYVLDLFNGRCHMSYVICHIYVSCITTLDTIIHHIVHIYTNNAYIPLLWVGYAGEYDAHGKKLIYRYATNTLLIHY
jgi:hypothetical protein